MAGREKELRENRAVISAVGIKRDQSQWTGNALPHNHRNISSKMYLEPEGSPGRATTRYFQQFAGPRKGQENIPSHSSNCGQRNEFFNEAMIFILVWSLCIQNSSRIEPGVM